MHATCARLIPTCGTHENIMAHRSTDSLQASVPQCPQLLVTGNLLRPHVVKLEGTAS